MSSPFAHHEPWKSFFHDAVQAAACLKVGADFLVTCNANDYRGAPIAPRSAGEVLAVLQAGMQESRDR